MSLVVFEGTDATGKSSLSLNFIQYLNKFFKDADGLPKIDPHLGDFVWTKEPQFSTEQADLLNSPGYIDEYRRERLFFESRIKHQKLIAGKNVICDRYIWSGLAYSYKYSPGCFRFAKELYLCEQLFIQPDLYVFVDTPPEVCCSRDPSLSLDVVRELREAYLKTKEYIKTPVLILPYVEGEEASMKKFVEMFTDYVDQGSLK